MSFVTIDNLSKSYGKVPALHGFSLTVNDGEIFAVVGPDGAGKTTMIRVVCNLVGSDSGSVMIDGIDAFKDYSAIKAILGYMPQSFSLYPDLSVEENLIFYAGLHGLTGKRYREKRDYLYDFSALAPFADRRASALSGGMKQKLALMCALLHDPKLLILDEPTTGVDPLSRRQFWEILLELRRQGRTIMVSTPYMDEVLHADRACFMLGGRKLSQGTPRELTEEFDGQIYFLDAEPDATLVKHINAIAGLRARRFGAGLHVYLSENDNVENHYPALQEAGVDPARLASIRPSLEDRFIQLMETGS